MKKLLPLFLVLSAQAQAPDFLFREKWIEFLNTWQNFVRVAYGCPLTVKSLNDQTCIAGNAIVDFKLFTKAQKQAEDIFKGQK